MSDTLWTSTVVCASTHNLDQRRLVCSRTVVQYTSSNFSSMSQVCMYWASAMLDFEEFVGTHHRIWNLRGWYACTSLGAAAPSQSFALDKFQIWAERTDSFCPRSGRHDSSSQTEHEGARLPLPGDKASTKRGCTSWRWPYQLPLPS